MSSGSPFRETSCMRCLLYASVSTLEIGVGESLLLVTVCTSTNFAFLAKHTCAQREINSRKVKTESSKGFTDFRVAP